MLIREEWLKLPNWFLPNGSRSPVTVTEISLEVTTHPDVLQLIQAATDTPQPPEQAMGEIEFRRFLSGLTTLAGNICQLVEGAEDDAQRASFRRPAKERVQILVMAAGGKLVGRVNGARQIFNANGVMVSDGKS